MVLGADKYGWLRGGKVSHPATMGASEVLAMRSGRFVKKDASGRLEIAGDGDTQLIGWVEFGGDETLGATEGAQAVNVITDITAVFKIPLRYDNSTYTVNYSGAILWETCDLVVVSGIQYANPTTSAEDTLVIVGGQAATSATADDGWLEVMLNPNKMHTAGVA